MKVFLLFLIYLSLLSLNICEEEFPLDKDVIILTDTTFDKAIKKYDYLLVLFYAPWDNQSKKFYNEYKKAATSLKKEKLYLAKVDATTEKKLADKYDIIGFPTVKLFMKKKHIEYNGGVKEIEIINWMKKKTIGPATKLLESVEEIEKIKKDNEVVVIYFGNNKDEIDEYSKVARKNEEILFAIVNSQNIINKYINNNIKSGTIILYKKFDEKKRELKTYLKEKNIEEFIKKYSTPKVMKFDEKTAQIIFGKSNPAIIVFASEKLEKWGEYETILRTISDKINDKIKIILTDIKEGITTNIAQYMGVRKSDLPTLRIIDSQDGYKKYKMKGEINAKNILKFVEEWSLKRIRPYLKSGKKPENNNGNIFTLVGDIYEDEVLKNDKDIMVLFYTQNCQHCKSLFPKYEKVSRILKKKNPKLIIAKIDAFENEIESINISGYPCIKFYPGNKKHKLPLEYNGDRSVEDMIKFIKNNAYNPIIYNEEKKEEKKIKYEEL